MDDTYYLYMMSTKFQDNDQIVILDRGATDFDLGCHMPDLFVYWRDKRHICQNQKQLEKCRRMLLEAAGNLHLFV